VAIVLVVVAAAIGKVVSDLIKSALGNRSYAPLLGTLCQVFLVALGIIAALNQLDIRHHRHHPVLVFVLGTIGGIWWWASAAGWSGRWQQRTDGWLSRMERELKANRPLRRSPAISASNGTMPRRRHDGRLVRRAPPSSGTERLPRTDPGGPSASRSRSVSIEYAK